MKKQFSKYPAKKVLALENAARLGTYKNLIKSIAALMNSAPNIHSENLKFKIGFFNEETKTFDLPQICAIIATPDLLLKSLQNCSDPASYLKNKDFFGRSILHLFLMNTFFLHLIPYKNSPPEEIRKTQESRQDIINLFEFLSTNSPQIFNSKDHNENSALSYVIENIPKKTFLFILLLSFGASADVYHQNVSPPDVLQQKINLIEKNSVEIWSNQNIDNEHKSELQYLLENWLGDEQSFTKEHLDILQLLPTSIQEQFAFPPKEDIHNWHNRISKHQLLNVWLSKYLLTKQIQPINTPPTRSAFNKNGGKQFL